MKASIMDPTTEPLLEDTVLPPADFVDFILSVDFVLLCPFDFDGENEEVPVTVSIAFLLALLKVKPVNVLLRGLLLFELLLPSSSFPSFILKLP